MYRHRDEHLNKHSISDSQKTQLMVSAFFDIFIGFDSASKKLDTLLSYEKDDSSISELRLIYHRLERMREKTRMEYHNHFFGPGVEVLTPDQRIHIQSTLDFK